MPGDRKQNFFRPESRGPVPFGTVETSVEEDNTGVIALCGIIDYEMGPDIITAVDKFLKDPQINCIVFDLADTEFLHTEHMSILSYAHDNTMVAARKKMKLRNVNSNQIMQHLLANGLAHRLAIEGVDNLEGEHAWKLDYSRFRPRTTKYTHGPGGL